MNEMAGNDYHDGVLGNTSHPLLNLRIIIPQLLYPGRDQFQRRDDCCGDATG